MAQPLNFLSEIKWLFLFHKGENMSNTKKKYGVRTVSVTTVCSRAAVS